MRLTGEGSGRGRQVLYSPCQISAIPVLGGSLCSLPYAGCTLSHWLPPALQLGALAVRFDITLSFQALEIFRVSNYL